MVKQKTKCRILGLFLVSLMLIQPLLGFWTSKIMADETFLVSNLRTEVNANRQVTLRWDAHPEATGYYIFRMFDGDDSMPYIGYAMKPEYSEVPERGGFVYYLVIPFKKVGDKQIQGTYTQNTYSYTAPPTIQGLSAVEEKDGVHLTWSPSASATEYVVKRRVKGETTEQEIARTKSIEFIDDNALEHELGTTFIYNVYPLYQGHGVELQGLNENYVFVTIDKGQTPPKPTPPEPTPDADLEDIELIYRSNLNGVNLSTRSSFDELYVKYPLDFSFDFISLSSSADGEDVEITTDTKLPKTLGVIQKPTVVVAHSGSREIWRHTAPLDQSRYSFTIKRQDLGDSLTIDVNFYTAPYDTSNKSVDEVTSMIVNEMDKRGFDEFERIDYAFMYVGYLTQYTEGGARTSEAAGALVDQKADSLGLAKGFKAILDKAGIPCIVVTRESLPENSGLTPTYQTEKEAWNFVKYNGYWYHAYVLEDREHNVIHPEDPAFTMTIHENAFGYSLYSAEFFMNTDNPTEDDLKIYPELKDMAPQSLFL